MKCILGCFAFSFFQRFSRMNAVSQIFHGNAAIYYYSIFSLTLTAEIPKGSLKKREILFMERYLKTELLKGSADKQN